MAPLRISFSMENELTRFSISVESLAAAAQAISEAAAWDRELHALYARGIDPAQGEVA